MNKTTRDIMKLLNVGAERALQIQNRMERNGVDFSECTRREFETAAEQAQAETEIELMQLRAAPLFDKGPNREKHLAMKNFHERIAVAFARNGEDEQAEFARRSAQRCDVLAAVTKSYYA